MCSIQGNGKEKLGFSVSSSIPSSTICNLHTVTHPPIPVLPLASESLAGVKAHFKFPRLPRQLYALIERPENRRVGMLERRAVVRIFHTRLTSVRPGTDSTVRNPNPVRSRAAKTGAENKRRRKPTFADFEISEDEKIAALKEEKTGSVLSDLHRSDEREKTEEDRVVKLKKERPIQADHAELRRSR